MYLKLNKVEKLQPLDVEEYGIALACLLILKNRSYVWL